MQMLRRTEARVGRPDRMRVNNERGALLRLSSRSVTNADAEGRGEGRGGDGRGQ